MNLKKIFSFRTKYNFLLFLQRFKAFDYFKDTRIDSSRNQAYIFLAADYGNLGDVAITYAQTRFLNKYSDCQVIEIPISKSLEGLHFVKKHIKPRDLVTIVGGGNMGDNYDQIEYIRQLVIKWFPNNKIISFPQTADFADAPEGQKALKIAQKVYNNHPDLHLIAREKTSFETMKRDFPNAKVLLTPDIVLSLDKSQPKVERKGAVICLRNDKEKNLTTNQEEFILNSIKANFNTVSYYDTHINKNNLSVEERIKELNQIWTAFRSAELVITDRLHGMIFCYITATPCLVFQNNNHKVRETYDWIQANSNINLIENFSESAVEAVLRNKQEPQALNENLVEKYQSITKLLVKK